VKQVRGLGLASVLVLLCLVSTSLADRPRHDGSQELARKIDAALETAWTKENVTPASRATDLELLRRMTLDLLGTVPSLEELRAFEAEPETGRQERLVARLMADPRFQSAFAERLARITVGPGKKQDDLFYRRRRYTEWLRDQVAHHRPWDEVVREIVASEGVTVDGPANFIAAADGDPAKLAARTSRAFFGIRLDCAQCHDHPFTDWKQKDFEGIAAFYARVERKGPLVFEKANGDYELEDRKSGTPRKVEPAVPFAPDAVEMQVKRRVALGRWITDPKNPFFARAIANRLWAWLMGHGLIEPVDSIDEVKPRYPEILSLLENELRADRFDLEALVRAIVSTRAYALSSRGDPALTDAFAVYPLKPLHGDQIANAIWQATSFETEDDHRALLMRLARIDQTNKFMARHGADPDAEVPEDETLLQRLLLVNGDLLRERIKHDSPVSATNRLIFLAPSDEKLVEVAFLMVLARRPGDAELAHFKERLHENRKLAAEDLFWALLNSSEFAWNH
jgi:hypothetical protein